LTKLKLTSSLENFSSNNYHSGMPGNVRSQGKNAHWGPGTPYFRNGGPGNGVPTIEGGEGKPSR